MTIPTVRATSSYNTTSVAPFNLTLPTYSAGDLVVIWALRNNAGTWTTPSGWNLLLSDGPQASGSAKLAVFWRKMDGTEGATLSMTSSTTTSQRHAVIAVTFQNYDSNLATPIQATGTNAHGSATSTITYPTLTPSGLSGAPDLLWLTNTFDIGQTYTGNSAGYNNTLTVAMSLGCVHKVQDKGTSYAASESPGTHGASANTNYISNTYVVIGAEPKTVMGLMNTSGSITARLGGQVGLSSSMAGRANITIPAPADTSVMGVVAPAGAITANLAGQVGVGGPLSTSGQFTAVLGLLNSAAGGFARLYPGLGARKFPDVNSRGYPK